MGLYIKIFGDLCSRMGCLKNHLLESFYSFAGFSDKLITYFDYVVLQRQTNIRLVQIHVPDTQDAP